MTLENGQDFASVFDETSRLWTPHRMAYISGENKPRTKDKASCPFCSVPDRSDEDGLIVYRGTYCYVVMNLYPYNSGHILVVPYRHIPFYTDLNFDERVEFGEITSKAMKVLSEAISPNGFNLGMNQGDVAGAGIAGHLHQHIVPRWMGDANFFPIIAKTKALPQLLGEMRTKLANIWEQVD